MNKLTNYDGEIREESKNDEDLEGSSFFENFKRQNKNLLLVAAITVIGIVSLVGIATYKQKSASENLRKAVPENASTDHARKAVELLRQISPDIDPDQDNIANTLQAVCTSAKKEFDRIDVNELDMDIRVSLTDALIACRRAIIDLNDPLVVPEDIEDITRTLKYRKIRDKSFGDNISKTLSKREEAAKKLGM